MDNENIIKLMENIDALIQIVNSQSTTLDILTTKILALEEKMEARK